jgi:hypothetical protein
MDLGRGAAVQWGLVRKELLLHHAQMGTGETQENVCCFEDMIPEFLNHSGDTLIYFQQVCKLIDKQRQAVILCKPGDFLQRLFPTGVRKTFRGSGSRVLEVVYRVREGAQLR